MKQVLREGDHLHRKGQQHLLDKDKSLRFIVSEPPELTNMSPSSPVIEREPLLQTTAPVIWMLLPTAIVHGPLNVPPVARKGIELPRSMKIPSRLTQKV
ncbi:MAG TPA: hypothetical protein VF141_15095 [Chryseolinea sp.]